MDAVTVEDLVAAAAELGELLAEWYVAVMNELSAALSPIADVIQQHLYDAYEYTYLGDSLTDADLVGQYCNAVRRDGKCVRGNGSMLVEFADGKRRVVLARQLRRHDKHTMEALGAMVKKRMG